MGEGLKGFNHTPEIIVLDYIYEVYLVYTPNSHRMCQYSEELRELRRRTTWL